MSTVTERILARIDVTPGGCWVWTGPLTPDGYARRQRAATRAAVLLVA